jgi:hypothetical protein
MRETTFGQLAQIPWAIPTVTLGIVVIVVVAGLILGTPSRAA